MVAIKGDPPGDVGSNNVADVVLPSLSKESDPPAVRWGKETKDSSSNFQEEVFTKDVRESAAANRSSALDERDTPTEVGDTEAENVTSGFEKEDAPAEVKESEPAEVKESEVEVVPSCSFQDDAHIDVEDKTARSGNESPPTAENVSYGAEPEGESDVSEKVFSHSKKEGTPEDKGNGPDEVASSFETEDTPEVEGNGPETVAPSLEKEDTPEEVEGQPAEKVSYASTLEKEDKHADTEDISTASVVSTFKDSDRGAIAKQLMETGKECRSLAQDTIQLCNYADTKGAAMGTLGKKLEFSLALKSVDSIDASSLSNIHDVISGDMLKSAMSLAQGAKNIAQQCIDNSDQMTEVMERGLKTLPGMYEGVVNRALCDPPTQEDLLVTDIEQAAKDVELSVDCIQKSNLLTAFAVSIQEVNNLPLRINLTKAAVLSIRSLAEEVSSNMEIFSLSTMNQFSFLCRARDLRRSLRSNQAMKQHAKHVLCLMQATEQLCDTTSTRLSPLLATLVSAKDSVAGCVEPATSAKTFCKEAQDKSNTLVTDCLGITDDIKNISKLDANSFSSLISFIGGNRIQDAIDLATSMDGLVNLFTKEVITIVDSVSETYAHLPPVMLEGIPENAGSANDDPCPPNVQKDIEELKQSTEALEKADFSTTGQAIMEGRSTVWDKINVCKDLLATMDKLTDKLIETINSFLDKWNLEEVQTKIMEMCRIVSLGVTVRQFAAQVQSLLKPLIALMHAIRTKLRHVTGADAFDEASAVIEDVVQRSSVVIEDAAKVSALLLEGLEKKVVEDVPKGVGVTFKGTEGVLKTIQKMLRKTVRQFQLCISGFE